MIEFREIDDANPALAHSPMVQAIEKTFAYIKANGGIGLTPSKAFKRTFVHWAATEFEWPGFSDTDLFAVNKVLNEIDFPPLMDLHDVMIALKIARHFKGQFKLTKAGESLDGHPGRLFGIIIPFYLFEVDHLRFSRRVEKPLGNWDIFFNVLHVEAEGGVTGGDIRRVLYGEPDVDEPFDYLLSDLYLQVLRPLCWTGLLQEERKGRLRRTEQSVFMKTPLWRAALRL
jgi:hypothetical protein